MKIKILYLLSLIFYVNSFTVGIFGINKIIGLNKHIFMYYEKYKIESVCIRIASCAPVTTSRSLSSWLSYDDLITLVTKSIDTIVTGFSVLYGVSNNTRKNVDNSESSHIGFIPKDDAEIYAKKILQSDLSEEIEDVGHKFHGGPFASTELGVSPLKKMKIIDSLKDNNRKKS